MSSYFDIGTSSSNGSAYFDIGSSTPATSQKKSKGGLVGTLSRIPGRFGSNIEDAAVQSVTGTYKLGKDLVAAPEGGWGEIGQQWVDLFHGNLRYAKNDPLKQDVQGIADSYKAIAAHPLRDPGFTALALLPGIGVAGRTGMAASTLAKTGKVRAATSQFLAPDLGPRVVNAGGMPVTGHYSRSAPAMLVQKGADTLLQKGKPGGRVENRLHARAAKWNERNLRVQEAVARTPGTRLAALGAKLTPAEQRALRLVALEVPVGRTLGAHELRAAQARHPEEAARHQERIALTKDASKFLDDGPDGKPVIKPGSTKLRLVYDALVAASADRGAMLKNLDLMDETAQQAAKNKAASFSAGVPETVSAAAPFIGNPVEMTRLLGRPKVSSTGTFGHTRKLGSLKEATGASVERALERNDVTNVVAERHAEVVRLSSIQRRVNTIKRAGKPVPGRRDDVFVWTDKTTSSERIPAEVRKYLDNPDSIAKLPEHEQASLMDKLRAATFEWAPTNWKLKHDWDIDPESRAKFEDLAKKGKGVFVPRRLLGDAGKRSWNTSTPNALVRGVDTVNNAQKAALIYLKANYPLIQGLSNVAMNIIEGAANPFHVTRAVKTYQAVGPAVTAVVEDIMGQGAVLQAAFHGEGAVSHVSQKLAGVMTRKVDKPARLNAFHYEAEKLGYGSPEKFKSLLEDDKNVHDLVVVAQRAKEAIVDYGELSPFERNVVRRVVFVYPWQKGATKYAGHFLRDHPVQAAALGMLGEQGAQINEQKLGPVPSYLKGVFDPGSGLVNPAGVNFFQTPAQIGRAGAGLVTGSTQAASGQEFLSPAPAALVALLSNRDSLGRPLKGRLPQKLRHVLVEPAPIAAATRAVAKGHGGALGDTARTMFGSHTESKTFPSSNDALWRFLFGGLYPREYDRAALNRSAALEKTGR